MADDDAEQLDFDVSGAVKKIAQIAAALGDVDTISVKVNKTMAEQEGIWAAVTAIFTGVNEEGQKVTRVLKDIDGTFQIASKSIKGMRDASENATIALAAMKQEWKQVSDELERATQKARDWDAAQAKMRNPENITAGPEGDEKFRKDFDRGNNLAQVRVNKIHAEGNLLDDEKPAYILQQKLLEAQMKGHDERLADEQKYIEEMIALHGKEQGDLQRNSAKFQAALTESSLRGEEEALRIKKEANTKQLAEARKIKAQLLENDREMAAMMLNAQVEQDLATDANYKAQKEQALAIKKQQNDQEIAIKDRLIAELIADDAKYVEEKKRLDAQIASETIAANTKLNAKEIEEQKKAEAERLALIRQERIQRVQDGRQMHAELLESQMKAYDDAATHDWAEFQHRVQLFRAQEAQLKAITKAAADDNVKAEYAKQMAIREVLKEEARDMTVLAREHGLLAQKTNQFNDGMLLSWRTMSRLLTIQLLHTYFREVIESMRQSIETAREFEIRIAEIQTISQSGGRSFDSWSASIKLLSDTFGKSMLDVSEGTYQALSSQIVDAAHATEFMNTALKLSQITISTTKEATDALSGAMRAFGIDASHADEVASSLFKTVTLGKVRLSDMSETIGRVGVISSKVGVDIYELEAAIVTLTNQGVKFADASTQITNLLTNMLHPTKGMQDLFREWGVTSGQSASQMFGFAGVLHKIEEATGGAAKGAGGLIRDVRGLRAELGLGGESLSDYDKNLERVKDQTESVAASQIVAKTAGQQFTIEMTKLQNTLTVDFAEPFLKHALEVTGALGGVQNIVVKLTEAIVVGGTAFAAYKLAMLAVDTQAKQLAAAEILLKNVQFEANGIAPIAINNTNLLARAYGFLLSPVGLLTAGIGLLTYQFLDNMKEAAETADAYDSLAAKIDKLSSESIAGFKKQMEGQVASMTVALRGGFQEYYDQIQRINRLENEFETQHAAKMKELARDMKIVFGDSMKEMESNVKAIGKLADEAASAVDKARNLQHDLAADTATRAFEAKIKGAADPAAAAKILKDTIGDLEKDINSTAKGADSLNPVKAKENEARIQKDIAEQTKLIAQLEERSAKAANSKVEIEEKIQKLKDLELARKEIDSDKDNVEAARDAARAGRPVPKKKNRKTIDPALLEEVRNEKASLTEDQRSERDLRTTNEIDDQEKKLALLNRELKVTGDLATLTKQRNDLVKEQQAILENFANGLQKVAIQEQNRHQKEVDHLEKVKELLGPIQTFKTEDLTKRTAIDQLNDYDKLVGEAKQEGISQKDVDQIKRQRILIEEDLAAKSRVIQEETTRQNVENDFNSWKKAIEETAKAKVAAEEDAQKRIETFRQTALETAKQIAKKHSLFNDAGDVKNLGPNIEKAVKSFQETGSTSQMEDIQLKLAKLSEQKDGKLFTKDIGSSTVKAPDEFGRGGKTIFDYVGDVGTAIANLKENSKLLEDATKKEIDLKREMSKWDTEPQIKAQIAKEAEIGSLQKATEGLDNFKNALKSIETEITTLLKNGPASPHAMNFNPSVIGGGLNVIQPNTQEASNTFNSPITINYYGTGDAAKDAVTLGREIANVTRKGFLNA